MNGFFKGKIYGSATVGERGQVVIPSEVRKMLNVKPGDKLIVLARRDRKMIGLIPAEDFSRFLNQAAKLISKLENRVSKKSGR
ncbi:MAG: AbrB/MazE/SpoVT family DNA-binding domain-containing protein [Candidatus Omnitrophota bacterium]